MIVIVDLAHRYDIYTIKLRRTFYSQLFELIQPRYIFYHPTT